MSTSCTAPSEQPGHFNFSPQDKNDGAAITPFRSFLNDLKIYCKCDCITPTIIPKDIPPLPLPVIGYLELTDYCNSQCIGCQYGYQRPSSLRQQNLGVRQWQIILEKLAGTVQRLQITGGEATLHPEFEDIINIIDQLQIPYVLFSNGMWRAPLKLLTFLNKKAYFDGFLISLHGADADTHELFSQRPGLFATVVKNIQQAAESGFSVFTSTVLFHGNYTKIAQIQDFAMSIGAEHTVFNRFVGQAPNKTCLTESEFKEAIFHIEKLKQSGEKTHFGNCIPQCFHASSASGCFAGTAFMSIDARGNMKPCNHANINCGNLLEQELGTVWNSPAMYYWRNLLPKQCRECAEFANCHGGCRAEALGTENQQDPLIREAFERKK